MVERSAYDRMIANVSIRRICVVSLDNLIENKEYWCPMRLIIRFHLSLIILQRLLPLLSLFLVQVLIGHDEDFLVERKHSRACHLPRTPSSQGKRDVALDHWRRYH